MNASSHSNERPHRKRDWTWWLLPRPIDFVSSLLYLVVLGAFLYNFVEGGSYQSGWWELLLMVGSSIALLTVDRLEFSLFGEQTPARVAVSLLLTRMVFIEVMSWLDHFDFSPFLYLLVPYLASVSFGYVVGYCFVGLAWVTYVVKHLLISLDWLSSPYEVHYLIVFSLGLVFVMAMVRVTMKEKASRTHAEQLLRALKGSHRQLKAYAEQVVELATTKERNRVARDIHDSLGHYLTVINVQLEKAQALRSKKPQEADQAVSDARRLAREALQDVRRSVGMLRTGREAFSCVDAVTALVEQVRTSQLVIDLRIEGREAAFSKQVLMILYRAVQEGLTNVQKHAGEAHVLVEILFDARCARLRVSDNGCGFEPSSMQDVQSGREGGYGLQGIQERLSQVGGLLSVESHPGAGTTLFVRVPKDPLVYNLPPSTWVQKE